MTKKLSKGDKGVKLGKFRVNVATESGRDANDAKNKYRLCKKKKKITHLASSVEFESLKGSVVTLPLSAERGANLWQPHDQERVSVITMEAQTRATKKPTRGYQLDPTRQVHRDAEHPKQGSNNVTRRGFIVTKKNLY